MEIYTLYSCDAWKSYSSMRLFFIGDSFKHVYAAIKKMIREEYAEYKSQIGMETTEEQVENLMDDMRSAKNHEERMMLIDHRLKYGHLSVNKNNSYC